MAAANQFPGQNIIFATNITDDNEENEDLESENKDDEVKKPQKANIFSKEDTLFDAYEVHDDDDEEYEDDMFLEELEDVTKSFAKQVSNYREGDETGDFDKKEKKDEVEEEELIKSRLRLDPSYAWLLKDLALSNNKRVIDVTQLLDENDQFAKSKQSGDGEDGIENTINSHENAVAVTVTNQTEEKTINALNELVAQAEEKEIKQSQEEDEDEEPTYDDDHNDHNYINKLYEKIVNKPGDKTVKVDDSYFEEETDFADKTGEFTNSPAYAEWSRKFRAKQAAGDVATDDSTNFSPPDNKNNNKSKFSKSFEVSLDSIDNLIGRVDNGIKLKRNNAAEAVKVEKEEEEKKNKTIAAAVAAEEHTKVVESLKQEWTTMLSRLEREHKQKLEEQQKLNEAKLLSFQDEIKKSVLEQQEQFLKQQQLRVVESKEVDQVDHQQQQQQQQQCAKEETIKVNKNSEEVDQEKLILTEIETTSMSTNNTTNTTNSYVDNAKYMSDLRMELKAKHARHIQDLKDYYEKELEDFRLQVNLYKAKCEHQASSDTAVSFSNSIDVYREYEAKNEQLSRDYNELKTSYDCLLDKLVN